MKTQIWPGRCLPAAGLALACWLLQPAPLSLGADKLLGSFTSPSSEAKPWVYWFWLNGFVTKEAITADLESMKRAGIGGVIQNDPHLPTPNTIMDAKYMTPHWWELIQFAMREADRLGIKFDIFNGAGWSGSGGIWIKKEDAMQFIVASETKVSGPSEFSATLPNPPAKEGFSQPIAVIAFPTIPGDDIAFDQHVKAFRVGTNEVGAAPLFDHDLSTGVEIPAMDNPLIEFQLDKPLTIQSLVISFKNGSAPASGEVEISDDGAQYKKIADFSVFHPVHLPNYFTDRAEVNFSPVAARCLRIRFKHTIGPMPIAIQELGVSGSKRIEHFGDKAGYIARGIAYNPLASTEAESAAAKSSVIDLSSKMDKDGKLTWSVPAGSWTIIRLASTITGSKGGASQLETRGLDVDKFSRQAMDHHWNDGVMKKILEKAGPLIGKTFIAAHIDSWEIGEQNWTPRMREEFIKRRGYDPLPYFPIFSGRLVDSEAVTERFLWDYRLTIADLYSENYFGYFADLCKKNGLLFTNEAYGAGANFDYITSGSHADIPMGEFGAWIDASSSEDMAGPVKMATCIGHTYGRPIVQCESFTSGMPNSGYLGHPYRIKSMEDYQYTLGCNRNVLSIFSMQPWVDDSLAPGMTLAQWGTQFGRTVTWWDMAGAWIQYVTRTSSMLQQGTFSADVCVFQGEEDEPNMGTLSRRAITPQIPSGFDYDVCDTPTLLNRLEVEDGRLVLPDGMSYRFLALQKSRSMTPAMLRKVGALVKAGAVVIGDKPAHSLGLKDYPNSDMEVRQLADEIWGDCDGVKIKEHAYGKGRVICGETFAEISSAAGLAPDFAYRSNDPKACVNFVHRRTGDAEIYFLANWNRKICETTCSFRVANLQPEIWNPETGQIEKCPIYKQRGAQTEIPIRLEPAASLFVIFRHPAEAHYAALEEKPAGDATLGAASAKATAITIVKAVYGASDDPSRSADITQMVRSKLKDNHLLVRVGRDTGPDPAPGQSKNLRVEYLQDGQLKTAKMGDDGELILPEENTGRQAIPNAVVQETSQGTKLLAYKAGQYTLLREGGTRQEVDIPTLPNAIDCDDHWEVRFQPKRGAPEKIRLEKLISLSDHPDAGVKYFSGTATYSRVIKIPADWIRRDRALYLDLGDVEVMARITFNHKDLGILWKPPFRVDISSLAKAGDNELEVKVADLWVNRLIGDEQLPADLSWAPGGYNYLTAIPDWLANGTPRTSGRVTFGVYQYWKKTDPLVPSGLIGPVKIIPVQVVQLKE